MWSNEDDDRMPPGGLGDQSDMVTMSRYQFSEALDEEPPNDANGTKVPNWAKPGDHSLLFERLGKAGCWWNPKFIGSLKVTLTDALTLAAASVLEPDRMAQEVVVLQPPGDVLDASKAQSAATEVPVHESPSLPTRGTKQTNRKSSDNPSEMEIMSPSTTANTSHELLDFEGVEGEGIGLAIQGAPLRRTRPKGMRGFLISIGLIDPLADERGKCRVCHEKLKNPYATVHKTCIETNARMVAKTKFERHILGHCRYCKKELKTRYGTIHNVCHLEEQAEIWKKTEERRTSVDRKPSFTGPIDEVL